MLDRDVFGDVQRAWHPGSLGSGVGGEICRRGGRLDLGAPVSSEGGLKISLMSRPDHPLRFVLWLIVVLAGLLGLVLAVIDGEFLDWRTILHVLLVVVGGLNLWRAWRGQSGRTVP